MASNQKQEKKMQEIISSKSDESEQIDAIAKIRGWFRPQDNSTFYPHVQAYMAGTADLTETIKQITEPLDAAISANRSNDNNFLDLWYSILHSAKRIPFRNSDAQAKLVELVKVFKDRSEQSEYSSLPGLNMASREVTNDSPGVGAGYTDPEAHAYANLNYFFASITKESISDNWLYCIWEMRAALETVQKDDGPDDAHRPGTAAQKYNARVPAAAVWVLVLGKDLYEKEEDLTPTAPNQGNPAKGGELWNGVAGFSKERWALWRQRFSEIGELDEVSEETRRIAKEAVEVMERSEGS